MRWILLVLAVILIETQSHVATNQKTTHSHMQRANNIPPKHPKDISRVNHYKGPYVGSCQGGSECVQFVSCPAHVQTDKKVYCKTIGGGKGLCCSTGRNHTEPFNSKDRVHHLIKLDSSTVSALSRKSRSEMAQLRSKEARLIMAEEPAILQPGSASYSHFRNSRRFDEVDLIDVSNVANRALEIAIATKAFKDREGISNYQLEMGMIQEDLRPTPLGQACLSNPFCPAVADKYRRIDGTCNNQYNPLWGSSLTPYSRLLPPSYSDGVWAPRVSQHGHDLPSPRLISSSLFNDDDAYHAEYTLILSQFGQFIAHEMTQSIDSTYANGSAISCCTQDGWGTLSSEFRHFSCMPISIPREDEFYGHFKQGCTNFVRSVLAPRQDCTLGYAQQMNKVTHFLDGSSIYGSTPEQTGHLRSFTGGKLEVFEDYGRNLLPLSKDPDACLTMERGNACFDSGDTRTNQMITLVILHTIFMREHNRIAQALAELNPHWDDEKIFLEARQIIVAELQVVTYKEFLPAVIGDLAIEEFELGLQSGYDYSFDYDQRVEPSVINEFASAAFRFGHSTVDGVLKVYGMKRMEQVIAIPEVMFYPSQIRRKPFMDMLLSALTTESIQEVDASFPEALTKYLFRGGNPFGVDLPSLNIQRGRDHGLRPYNDYRELIGLPRYTSFEEFGPEKGAILSQLYASVDDVDLYIGGLLEPKAPGSLVGPTFRDIIADQFSRLKRGDKYFFENDPSVNPGHFAPEQLFELRKASMSRLICDNSDGILLSRQGPNAFKKPGVAGNEFVDCANSAVIPKVNLIFWKE